MSRTLSHYFSLVVMVVMLSCSDDEDDARRTDLLTAHAWIATKYEMGGTVADMIECSADDVLTFSKDGKFSDTVGPLTCDDDEKDLQGTWALKDNDQVLSMTIDGVTNEGTIVTLTSTTLKLKSKSILTEDGEVIGVFDDLYVIYTAK